MSSPRRRGGSPLRCTRSPRERYRVFFLRYHRGPHAGDHLLGCEEEQVHRRALRGRRGIKGWQNGLAITGDFVSVAGFFGIAGAVALTGFNGFYVAVGVPISFLMVLLVVAEPLRNLGKYTVPDMITSRFRTKQVRSVAAISTLTISLVYMIAQFVGAGILIQLLLGIDYNVAVVAIGVLMTIYVLAGGMLATTWIQIFKAVLLMAATLFLFFLVLYNVGPNPVAVFDEAAAKIGDQAVLPPPPAGL